MEMRLELLNKLLRGWISYYKIVEAVSVLKGLDSWIRRRLRMCKLTQWKKPKTRKKELQKLGISEKEAMLISSSGKGNWRLSLTPQLNIALGLTYWKGQGLISLAEAHKHLC
jgi:RNA-directed DNA polymerase